MVRTRSAPIGALLLLVLTASLAHADWLVTRDGARVETKGSWTVKGNQVRFLQTNGTLSALRLSEVDLDASAVATAKAAEEAVARPAAPAPKRAPVLRLTEKDFPPVTETAEDTRLGTPEAPTAGTEPLQITNWDRINLPEAAGVEIFGTVTNRGGALVTGGSVAISLYDGNGDLLVTETAELDSAAVAPGQTASFRVQFPGLLDFGEAKFAVSSRGYRIMQPAPQAGQKEAEPETPPSPNGES